MTLLDDARRWRDQDPDAETVAELDALIDGAETGDEDALAGLRTRFGARLAFGTAGLRGELAAGPGRMNRVVVTQAAAGFASFLLSRETAPSVVIGYDGRKNSQRFALDTAEIMAGAGVRTVLLPRLLPTPVLAFAVRRLGVSAGVMVTASHNPPNDNGYKVYLGGDDHGSQIVSPADTEIEQAIGVVAAGDIRELPRSSEYEIADESLIDEYVEATAALASPPAAPVRFVYTALHGVGWETASRVFAAAGFEDCITVPEQLHPDAAFPTVAFPNPEEPGALDLAYRTASEAGADLIVANDPDADRLAVAIPHDHGWRRLSGNEVGILLGSRAAERHPTGTPGALAASLVSSPVLAEVAKHHGLGYAETLTGFKWVSRVPNLVYGYEEALGYLVDPAKVRDKDGISAALAFLDLTASLHGRGLTIADRLEELAAEYGAFASGQVSVRVADTAEIGRMMTALRTAAPQAIGGEPVVSVDDYLQGVDGFPPSDILKLRLADGSRLLVRPSGTEPKLKVYLDVTGPSAESCEARVRELEAAVRELLGVS